MEISSGIIITLILIAIITLFVISTSLTSISRNLRITRKLLSDWKKESGVGAVSTCNNCHNKYEGRPLHCPHCGTPIIHQ